MKNKFVEILAEAYKSKYNESFSFNGHITVEITQLLDEGPDSVRSAPQMQEYNSFEQMIEDANQYIVDWFNIHGAAATVVIDAAGIEMRTDNDDSYETWVIKH